MRALASPAFLASVSLSLALLVHPAFSLRGLGGATNVLVATLGLLLVISLGAQARGVWGLLLAGGSATVLLCLAYDALAGQEGSLTLGVGQAAHLFDETRSGGKALGYRPLGFEVALDALRRDGTARLFVRDAAGQRTVELSRDRAAGCRGFRFASPQVIPSGDAARLEIAVSRQGQTREVSLSSDAPASAWDMELSLERYFADFALDPQGKPYSRSPEAANPAALLRVRQGDESFTVFVIRAFPGVHRQESLEASFALLSVEPALFLRMSVFREPAAGLAGLGLLTVAVSLFVFARPR